MNYLDWQRILIKQARSTVTNFSSQTIVYTSSGNEAYVFLINPNQCLWMQQRIAGSLLVSQNQWNPNHTTVQPSGYRWFELSGRLPRRAGGQNVMGSPVSD
jgi:hypothetical protein